MLVMAKVTWRTENPNVNFEGRASMWQGEAPPGIGYVGEFHSQLGWHIALLEVESLEALDWFRSRFRGLAEVEIALNALDRTEAAQALLARDMASYDRELAKTTPEPARRVQMKIAEAARRAPSMAVARTAAKKIVEEDQQRTEVQAARAMGAG